MWNRFRNVVYALLMITFFSVSVYVLANGGVRSVTDDSGFDSSYDGGGSSFDSGSSYDGGSSSSYGSSSSGGGVVFFIILIIIVLVVLNSASKNGNTSAASLLKIDPSRRLTNDYIRTMIPNFNLSQFLSDRVLDFCDIQTAWMNFNYNKLREKLTDELYNQYEMQLKTLQTKGEQNIMSDFQARDMAITKIENINGKYEITMELVIGLYDYIVQNNRVVRGNSNRKIEMKYELVFVSSSVGGKNTCPHCGAELTNSASQVCMYCKSTVTQVSDKWVLSKKRAIDQI